MLSRRSNRRILLEHKDMTSMIATMPHELRRLRNRELDLRCTSTALRYRQSAALSVSFMGRPKVCGGDALGSYLRPTGGNANTAADPQHPQRCRLAHGPHPGAISGRRRPLGRPRGRRPLAQGT
eukprot:scaffold473644_cov29-Prasinocladus_malaysianus.AAC.1